MALAQCNGYYSLCDKKYDEVSYLTTHNAFNAAEQAYTLPNQTFGLTQQLNDGVRAFMLDVYYFENVVTVYHSSQLLGYEPLLSNLLEIKEFMDANPNEIVSIIFESYVTANGIDSVMVESGIAPYLFEKGSEDWPSLQSMIDNNKRLVVLSDEDDASATQGWYHYMWEHAVETHFSNKRTSDFSCDYNRGNPDGDLFILNHFITDDLIGIGEIDSASIINSNPYFLIRALECQQVTGKLPNFVTVDFHELGDCFDVVKMLNGADDNEVTPGLLNSNYVSFKLWPNPANNMINLEIPSNFSFPISLAIFDLNGQSIYEQSLQSNQLKIDRSEIKGGQYFIRLMDTEQQIAVEKLIFH